MQTRLKHNQTDRAWRLEEDQKTYVKHRELEVYEDDESEMALLSYGTFEVDEERNRARVISLTSFTMLRCVVGNTHARCSQKSEGESSTTQKRRKEKSAAPKRRRRDGSTTQGGKAAPHPQSTTLAFLQTGVADAFSMFSVVVLSAAFWLVVLFSFFVCLSRIY